jgi:hypothetical protein
MKNMKNWCKVDVRLDAAIKLYRMYLQRSKEVWDIYSEIDQAYYMFEYNIEMAYSYKDAILQLLEM